MSTRVSSRWNALRAAVPGVALAIALALGAKLASQEIGALLLQSATSPVSPVLCAVLIGLLWRNVIGVGRRAEQGLQWVMKTLLRAGIALVGLRLTFDGLASVGTKAFPIVIACIAVVAVTTVMVGRALRIPRSLQTLIGAGTAVCGCTAIVAMAPVIRARPAEVGLALGCIVLFGCLGMLVYPWVAHQVFGSLDAAAGVFLGTSIHDTTQVVGASLIYAQQFGAPDAVAVASATKFLRNISILVLVPLAATWRQECGLEPAPAPGRAGGELRRGEVFPGFVIAFVILVIVRTLGDHAFAGSAAAHDTWVKIVSAAQKSSELLLVCGMTAVGLSVSLSQMRHLGWRPVCAAFLIAAAAAVCSLALATVLL